MEKIHDIPMQMTGAVIQELGPILFSCDRNEDKTSFSFRANNATQTEPWPHTVGAESSKSDSNKEICRHIANSVQRCKTGYTAISFVDSSIQTNGEYVGFSRAVLKIAPIGKPSCTHTIIEGDNVKAAIYIKDRNRRIQAYLAMLNDNGEIISAEELQSIGMLSALNNAKGINRFYATVFKKDYLMMCSGMVMED